MLHVVPDLCDYVKLDRCHLLLDVPSYFHLLLNVNNERCALIINAILFWRTWTSLICVTNTHFHDPMLQDQVATLFSLRRPFAFPSYKVTNLHLPWESPIGFWPADEDLPSIIKRRSLFVGADGRNSLPDSPCPCVLWWAYVTQEMLLLYLSNFSVF